MKRSNPKQEKPKQDGAAGTPTDEPVIHKLGEGVLLSGGNKQTVPPVRVYPADDPYGLEDETTDGGG